MIQPTGFNNAPGVVGGANQANVKDLQARLTTKTAGSVDNSPAEIAIKQRNADAAAILGRASLDAQRLGMKAPEVTGTNLDTLGMVLVELGAAGIAYAGYRTDELYQLGQYYLGVAADYANSTDITQFF